MTTYVGNIMAQTVSRRLLAAEAWVRFQVSPYGICGGQSGTGTDFYLSTSVLPRHYHSTIVPTLYYMRPAIKQNASCVNRKFATKWMYSCVVVQFVLDTAFEIVY